MPLDAEALGLGGREAICVLTKRDEVGRLVECARKKGVIK